jgi:periplasmic protein TonB
MKKVFIILFLIFSKGSFLIAQSVDYDTTLCLNPEQKADFKGGMGAFANFLQKNLKCPPKTVKANVGGKIYIEFIVEKDSTITHFNVLKSVGLGWDEEVIRVLKLNPKWIPAKDKGKVVRSKFPLPISCLYCSED